MHGSRITSASPDPLSLSSKRPSEYKVKYTIDGEDHYENFPNKGK